MNTTGIYRLFFVNLKLCLLELWSNKTRSFITSLGIFLGVTSLLVNISFIRAMEDNVRENLNEIGGLSILTISTRNPASDQERVHFSRSPGLSTETVEAAAGQFEYVQSVLPQKEFRNRISTSSRSGWGRITAISPDHFRVYNYELSAGEQFTQMHHQRGEAVCVIGSRIAEHYFGSTERSVGRSIQINGVPFRVIGHIHTENNRSWRARQVLIPFSSYLYQFSRATEDLSEIAVELESVDDVPKALIDLRYALKALHRGVEDFDITSNDVEIQEMRTASRGLRIILGGVAAISLIVGGISIMNIMFATIGDRIREIGVRKALGARRSDLFTQFIIEAVTFSLAGGFLGIVAATIITLLPSELFPIRPQLTPADYLIAVTFTATAGLISGLFPALRAAKMEPVEALRY